MIQNNENINRNIIQNENRNQNNLIIKGLRQNNLKNISLHIPKNKIVVFTGVSGSGKSSIVFDTIAAESQRQMNETYSAFVRSRLPKHEKPKVDTIENLSSSVIVDQSRLGGNARSTVGTITDMYAMLRLLYSRIGQPYVGTASCFSFNDPSGMCPACSGLGKIMKLDIEGRVDPDKSWNEGMADLPAFHVGQWYWKQYANSGLFPTDKKYRDFTETERSHLLYGADTKDGPQLHKKVEGIARYLNRMLLHRDFTDRKEPAAERLADLLHEELCPACKGRRLSRRALACWVNGYSIDELSAMEFTQLRHVLSQIKDPRVQTIVETLTLTLTRMIDIGLPYLSMDRESSTLSGGEAQRLKLVRYMGSSLTGLTYIFDEPSTGMHPRDVYRMTNLLRSLRDKGNSVLVVEHDRDVISIADEVIDVGPQAGSHGGEIMFQGSYEELLASGTLTGNAMKHQVPVKEKVRVPKGFLPVRGARVHNLKNVDVDIPTGVLTVVTGVAGSGKSSLIRDVFAKEYADRVVLVDQSPVTATGRSTPATFLGFFDTIRKLLAEENHVDPSLFSFNSKGACPVCGGRGVIVTELVFMDPVTTVCEACEGTRYSKEALDYTYKGKNIVEILDMSAEEAEGFFSDVPKLRKALHAMVEVGLPYLSPGQPLSTLSGGERQRVKLAKYLDKKGNIYVLDEPTTGLHASDIESVMKLLDRFVDHGNTVIVIEHNTDVMRQADYIIDVGPDGGTKGGEIVFTGTLAEMLASGDTITARCLRISESSQIPSPDERKVLAENRNPAEKVRAMQGENSEEDGEASVEITEEEENNMSGLKLNPIGRVESDYGQFKVVLCEQYKAALKGLEGFSHVQVLWWFDGCDNDHDRSMLVAEKPYTKGPDELGTFATRSPMRPNPIAVTTAEIVAVDLEKGVLILNYIDALTGTPVLDIKPYTPSLDRVENPQVPSWCAHWPESYETSDTFDWSAEM